MSRPTPDAIKKALCDLTVVEPNAYGFEIALPQIYGNGEVVTVTVQEEAGGYYIHDGGGAAMVLESMGASVTTRIQEDLRKGVSAYGCMFSKFRVYKRCGDASEIASSSAIVGCASRFVADYIFQAEAAPMFDFRRQVVETLNETIGAGRVRENVEITAKTGTKYHVSAAILDERKSKPVAYIEAVSGHQAVARKFRTLYDLKTTPLVAETSRFSVFDDLRSGITDGDLALLKEVSEIIPFTNRAQILKSLETIH